MPDACSQLEQEALSQLKRNQVLTKGLAAVISMVRSCGSPEEVARVVHSDPTVSAHDFQRNLMELREAFNEEMGRWDLCVDLEGRERLSLKTSTRFDKS